MSPPLNLDASVVRALGGRLGGAVRRVRTLQFDHLRTKLTVLFVGLFVAILVLILSSVYAAVARNAERIVRGELAASGLVFDRIWALRSQELGSGASVMAHDFGFRAAVATQDAATIQSALTNLRARLGIDEAFVVGLDGQVLADSSATGLRPGPEVLNAIASQDEARGVFVMGGTPFEAVSEPIMTPVLSGWVVFAVRLDQREMTALRQLSAIPLQPGVLVVSGQGALKADTNGVTALEREAVQRFLGGRQSATAQQGVVRLGPSVAVIKPLATMADDKAALLLSYPLAQALKPYDWLLGAMLILGLLGLGLIAAGSWALAQNVTRPILALRDAAERLQRGEDASVEVEGTDEIAALERSFNTMAQTIRERERDLKASTERAELASRAKSEFLSNMSHEIRTPLNGILGMAQVMSRQATDPEHRQRLDVIRDSGEALLGVLNSILDISKIEAGTLEIELQDFDLATMVEAACAPYATLAAEAGLSLTIELAADVAGPWRGDRLRLRQILGNIVSNAVKFTPAGSVKVAVGRGAAGLVFAVTDTGVGIPAAYLDWVFESFAQVDGSATRRTGGVGVGLSISRDLVGLMGGTIQIQSREGEGTVVTFEVPLEAKPLGEARPIAPEASAPEAAADARPLRILAAEDNKTNQMILTALLEPLGLDLTLVENGREAVEAFARGDFDLVLMDIQMPEMTGVEATVAIRRAEAGQSRAPIPILAVTANVMSHQVAEYREVGMSDVIAKPIEAGKLFEAMEAALDAAEAAQAGSASAVA
ncbi:ATP-binding protein [Phenylobacterium aquaticum]|uniref:ATP-binding protein n=1 Tax=Phenylobacterium aquaticum TaxID=1763816 RepID=UPI0026E9E004|nr:ATP-binding protein [Phenylobacterium aquaticum]